MMRASEKDTDALDDHASEQRVSRGPDMRAPAKSLDREAGVRVTPPTVALVVAALVAVLAFPMGLATIALSQSVDAFPNLEVGRRVYDETTTSLTPEQIADLDRQLGILMADGADVIVYVRALDVDPDETLDQVEALQQAWVATTGADQDRAVAILINRNPDDPNDARAGIYVGSAYDDGNVPRDEQRDIVDDELIPPLRHGDVYGSVTAGLTRLDGSIRNGPPQSGFERWAESAAGGWLPWAGLAAAVAGLAAALALFRRRATTALPEREPTTSRPGDLTPALAGALATGGPQASAVPATLLDLAARGALAIEPESDGGVFSTPKVQVRLMDRRPVNDDVEAALWAQLERRAEDGVVSSKDLAKLTVDGKPVREVVRAQMRAEGWLAEGVGAERAGLVVIAVVAAALAVFGVVVAAAAGAWLPLVAVAPLTVVALAALGFLFAFSGLSRRGQEAALPWTAYREGLEHAANDEAIALDLDAVLPDTVAFNLGSAMNDRLKRANESGQALRAFAAITRQREGGVHAGYFPYWVAFNSTVASSSGSSAGTVSGGGAGGGGGAAGST